MFQPKFSVGEIVILQSKNRPDLNGEYSVIGLKNPGHTYYDPITDKNVRLECAAYMLDGADMDVTKKDGQRANGYWHESSLRKRHQPGEYSFDALKQILAMPVDRRDFA